MIDATLQTLGGKRFLRFLIAGAINSIFGFLVYTVAILLGGQVWLALLAGLVCGAVFNFFSTGAYVFRDLGLSRAPRFLVCYLLIYFLNLKLIDWLSLWITDPIIAQAILVGPMAIVSYVLMSRFVFFKRPAPQRE